MAIRSGKVSILSHFIKSAEDAIEFDEESVETAPDGGADGEGTEEFAGVEEDFVDDANDIGEFGDSAPPLDADDAVDAVQAIAEIANTILEEGGEGEADEAPTSEETSFVLDEVEDLADGVADAEAAGDELEGMDLEASASISQGASPAQVSLTSRTYLTREAISGQNFLVASGFGPTFKLKSEPKMKVVDSLLVSSVEGEVPSVTGFISAGEIKDWIKSSPAHKVAWMIASGRVARQLAHKPATLGEFAAVAALASGLKLDDAGAQKILSAFEGKDAGAIKRVARTANKWLVQGKQFLHTDFNGYANADTWTVATRIVNDPVLSHAVVSYARAHKGEFNYAGFIKSAGLIGKAVDGVAYDSPSVKGAQIAQSVRGLIKSDGGNNKQLDANSDPVETVQSEGGAPLKTTEGSISKEGLEIDTKGIPEGMKPSNVAPTGGTHKVDDLDLTGDDGDTTVDTVPGEPFSGTGYDFDSNSLTALEVPLDEEEKTQVVEFREVASGVHVLKSCYTAPGSGRFSFTRGVNAKKVVSSMTKPSPLLAKLDGRVLTLGGSTNGLIIKQSALLGLVAIEAPIQKGLKNSVYSVFVRSGVNLVNKDGQFITMPKGPSRVIASGVGNKAVRQGLDGVDIFASVEGAYVNYLRRALTSAYRQVAALKRTIKSNAAAYAKKEAALLSSSAQAKDSARKAIAQSYASLESLRKEEADRLFLGNAAALADLEKARAKASVNNVEHLSKMFSSFAGKRK